MPVLGGASSSGSGLPTGGASGAALVKQSSADGDATWVSTVSASGAATISGLWNFTQAPQVNGTPVGTGSGGASAMDAYAAPMPSTLVSGAVYPFSAYSGLTAFFGGVGVGVGFPLRVTTPGTFYLGTRVTTAGTGARVRFTLFTDDGKNQPGTLVADLGTIDSSTTGAKFTATSVNMSTGVRYWVILSSEVADCTLQATVTTIPVGYNASVGQPGSIYHYAAGPYSSNPTTTGPTADAPFAVYAKAV